MAKKKHSKGQIFSNFIYFFYMVSSKLRYTCATSLDSQKNILFNGVKFDLTCHLKKSSWLCIFKIKDVIKLKKISAYRI
jgi:hypothetical protein